MGDVTPWERLAATWALQVARIRNPTTWNDPPPTEAELYRVVGLLREEMDRARSNFTTGHRAKLSRARLLERVRKQSVPVGSER